MLIIHINWLELCFSLSFLLFLGDKFMLLWIIHEIFVIFIRIWHIILGSLEIKTRITHKILLILMGKFSLYQILCNPIIRLIMNLKVIILQLFINNLIAYWRLLRWWIGNNPIWTLKLNRRLRSNHCRRGLNTFINLNE